MKRIRDKSGAPADLLDYYQDDKPANLDIYMDRWDFAPYMSFFVPACARSSYNVSLGNAKSSTQVKPKRTRTDDVAIDDNTPDDSFSTDFNIGSVSFI